MHGNQPYRGVLLPLVRMLGQFLQGVARGWGETWHREPPLSKLQPARILVIESHLLGDQVMMLPFLEKLATAYPTAELHILANPWFLDLVDPLPERWFFHPCRIPWSIYDFSMATLQAVVAMTWRLRELKVDLAIDVRGDLRNMVILALTGAKRRVGYGGLTGGKGLLTDPLVAPPYGGHLTESHRAVLLALGCAPEPYLPALRPTPEQEIWARSLLQSLGCTPHLTLGIHPGASQVERAMPVRHMVELVERVRELGWQPLFLGGDREAQSIQCACAQIQSPPPVVQVPLREFVAICSEVGHMVTMDSGPAHIAAATGCKTTIIIRSDKLTTTTPLGLSGVIKTITYNGEISQLSIEKLLGIIPPPLPTKV